MVRTYTDLVGRSFFSDLSSFQIDFGESVRRTVYPYVAMHLRSGRLVGRLRGAIQLSKLEK